jgi:hypothetical protein
MIDVEETLRAELHRLVPIDSRRDWNQIIANARLCSDGVGWLSSLLH